MSNKKIIIIVGVALMLLGFILMVLLKENEYGNLIGGLIIGAGGGALSVLFTQKKRISKNNKS